MTKCAAIRKVLVDGPSTNQEIAARLGIDRRRASYLLSALKKAGIVQTIGRVELDWGPRGEPPQIVALTIRGRSLARREGRQ